jgi:hypothetical protein
MIMSFKEWIAHGGAWHTFVFYETADLAAAAYAAYLVEGGRTWEIDNKWSVRMDRPHAPNMQDHVHVMLKGRDVSIINRDGTQSHGTNRDAVPNWLINRIKAQGLIESALIVEDGEELFIPSWLMSKVHYRARWHDLLAPITG